MNTQNPPDELEHRIDVALGRLPHWEPPPDFSVRLAAAAARQIVRQPSHAEPAWLVLLEQITRPNPVALASAGTAVILGWIVPWSQLSTGALVWTCVSVMGVAGLVLVRRFLQPRVREANLHRIPIQDSREPIALVPVLSVAG